MQRAILGKPTHILGQAFTLLRPLTQSPDSLVNIAASPPHSHLPGSGPGLPTGSAHRSAPGTAPGPGTHRAPKGGGHRACRVRKLPLGAGPASQERPRGGGHGRAPAVPSQPVLGSAAAHGTCAVRHVPHGGRHRDRRRGSCGGDGRRCARAGLGRAARSCGALRRRSRNGGGGGTEWPRPELSPRKRVQAAPGSAATRRAEGPAVSGTYEIKLSFRAQRCANGGGTAHAPPPPGTPARGPAEPALIGVAELTAELTAASAQRQCSSVTRTAELNNRGTGAHRVPAQRNGSQGVCVPIPAVLHELRQPHQDSTPSSGDCTSFPGALKISSLRWTVSLPKGSNHQKSGFWNLLQLLEKVGQLFLKYW